MAEDYNSLLDFLKIDSTYIIGQSDGGIIGLILAMNYPKKVKKLVTKAQNLRADKTALPDWYIKFNKIDLKGIDDKINRAILLTIS